MSKKASPTLVGLFVLGAIFIAVGAIVFFGTTKLFTEEKTFVCFFKESVTGLQVGAAVKFKGVPIGQVTKIQIRFNPDATTYIKILFEINADLLVNNLGADVNIFDAAEGRKQIERGLRATLKSESLITGMLYLELDYHPDAPPPVFLQDEKSSAGEERYAEMPTLPSTIEAIIENASKAIAKLSKIDFESIGKNLENLVATADKSLSEAQFGELSRAVQGAANSINELASSPDLKQAVVAARGALNDLSETLITLQKQIDPVAMQFTKTLGGLDQAAVQVDSALAVHGDLRSQLTDTLGELGEMAQALQRLSEFLERNPNSIIFGRKPPAKSVKPK